MLISIFPLINVKVFQTDSSINLGVTFYYQCIVCHAEYFDKLSINVNRGMNLKPETISSYKVAKNLPQIKSYNSNSFKFIFHL